MNPAPVCLGARPIGRCRGSETDTAACCANSYLIPYPCLCLAIPSLSLSSRADRLPAISSFFSLQRQFWDFSFTTGLALLTSLAVLGNQQH